MNKTSMDALNRGWSIGFGTQIHPRNTDFDCALARADICFVEPPVARSVTQRIGAYIADAEALIALLVRRLVH